MSLLSMFLGKKQEAPFKQLFLDELIQRLSARGLELRGTPLGNPPHYLHNETGTNVAGGIEVRGSTGVVLGELLHSRTFEGSFIHVYLPLGLYGSGGRPIDSRLVEELHAIGAIRSGLDSLPKTVPQRGVAGAPLSNNYYVTVNSEGRLLTE